MTKHLQKKIDSQLVMRRGGEGKRKRGGVREEWRKGRRVGRGQRVGGGEGERRLRTLNTGLWNNFQDI